MVNLIPFHKRRVELGLTYQQVADRVGSTESTVHRWFTGQSRMSVYDAVLVAHALRMPFPDVLANLKTSVEGAAIAAEHRRSQAFHSATIRTPGYADGKAFVDQSNA
ncbi:helix-turn-helix transcriptional regulator [Streptomyces sp. BH105]|uniref:helix-turn-helix transcriptional regulator n=1 Tax=Streptomyces sp. BH105 TaxID=3410408 RepID=UPI003CEDD480